MLAMETKVTLSSFIPNTKTPPEFPGLKLKNEDRAKSDGYYFFVGSENDIGHVKDALFQICGIYVATKANGKTGCWMLLCPLWVTGSIPF